MYTLLVSNVPALRHQSGHPDNPSDAILDTLWSIEHGSVIHLPGLAHDDNGIVPCVLEQIASSRGQRTRAD